MSAGAISSLAASAFAFDGNTLDDTTLGWGNSVRSSGAGMIAFGTVSGGAGAALTGGNFWQGAVTGLIVSGLNHAMHQVAERTTLKEMLIENGIDPDGIPNMTTEELYNMAYTLFSDMYTQAGCPDLVINRKLDGKNYAEAIPGDAVKIEEGVFAPMSVSKIEFGADAFRSFFRLAGTMGHELTHAIDYTSGFIAEWSIRIGYNNALKKSEINAHGWQINHMASYNVTRFFFLMIGSGK